MFKRKKEVDLKSHLQSFTHCWMYFHISGDNYAGRIKTARLRKGKVVLMLAKMSRCIQFYAGPHDIKEWLPIKHFRKYPIVLHEIEEMQSILGSRPTESDNDSSSTFRLSSGDVITLTSDPKEMKKIERILNMAP